MVETRSQKKKRIEELQAMTIDSRPIFDIKMGKEIDYICDEHINLLQEHPLCPPRKKCHQNRCKKKVCGYSNPDHVCNPFGYLYLYPTLCNECAISKKKCMWC
tara:strand:- start:276 stop:584 length:309 start_codon:yes stop_codon:yes gene_type:complete